MEEIVYMRGDDDRSCQQRKRGFGSWFFAILDRFLGILDRFLGILDRFLGSNEFSATSKTETITLHAIRNFDPKKANEIEKKELIDILERILKTAQTEPVQRFIQAQIQRRLDQLENDNDFFKMYEGKTNLNTFGDKPINPEKEPGTFDVTDNGKREERSDIQLQGKATKQEELEMDKGKGEFFVVEEGSDDNEMNSREAESELESYWDSKSRYYSKCEAELYSAMLPFKKEDLMKVLPSEYYSGTDGWITAWRLDDGKIGFIRKEHFTRKENPNGKYEPNRALSSKTLYNIPLEILDIILRKCYLHSVLKLSSKPRDEKVIRFLMSVDVCFNRRMTRQRFKTATWRLLKDFYEKTKKRQAIILNNRDYLLDNIEPNDELIACLVTLNCITKKERQFILRQRSKRKKNVSLLHIMRSFDEAQFLAVVKYLREVNEKTLAKVIESGGGAIQTEVQMRTTAMETQEQPQKPRTKIKLKSYRTDVLVSKLRGEDIEILNYFQMRQCMVVWIWCRSQSALELIKKLYEWNQLKDALFETMPSSPSMVINIDGNQFKKTVVVCQMSINFTARITIRGTVQVLSVTKLRHDIFVVGHSQYADYNYRNHCGIHVFEDQNPFRFQKEIVDKEIKTLWDIVSSEKEDCLYSCDNTAKCIWKITKEADGQYKLIKWLTTDYQTDTMSVSSDGRLLMIKHPSSTLMIYGSDAELIQAIQLPRDFKTPSHAVKTSTGNFIISHRWEEGDYEETTEEREQKEQLVGEEGKIRSSGRRKVVMYAVSELSGDGQTVIRRFIPSNEAQQLNRPEYLSLDSEDRVFVAELGNDRVVILDSDLKWNRIIYSAAEETEEMRVSKLGRLYYDKEMKQLIVVEYFGSKVNVYNLSRN